MSEKSKVTFTEKVQTNRFPLKCVACGLHFNVYSWDVEWPSKHQDAACPECGRRGVSLVLGHEVMKGEIFEYVSAVMSNWQREQIALLNTLNKEEKA